VKLRDPYNGRRQCNCETRRAKERYACNETDKGGEGTELTLTLVTEHTTDLSYITYKQGKEKKRVTYGAITLTNI